MVMVREVLSIVLVASFAVGVFSVVNPPLDVVDVDVDFRPVDKVDFLDDQGKILSSGNDHLDGYLEEVSRGPTKCMRYCAQWKHTEHNATDSPLINFQWTFNSGMTAGRWIDAINNHSKSENKNVNDNHSESCMISVVTECKTSDIPVAALNDFFVYYYPDIADFNIGNNLLYPGVTSDKLLEKRNLNGTTEESFSVYDNIKELRIIVLGNITEISLKTPFGKVSTRNLTGPIQQTPELMLTRTRMYGDSCFRLNVRNPSAGRWRLELSGPTHSDYHVVVVGTRASEHQNNDASLESVAIDEMSEEMQVENKDDKSTTREKKVLDTKTDGSMKNSEKSREKRSLDSSHLTYHTDDSTGRLPPVINSRSNIASYSGIPENFDEDDEGRHDTIKFPGHSSASAEVSVHAGFHNYTARQAGEQKERGISDKQSYERELTNRRVQNELPRKKNLVVDVDPATNLIVENPGSLHPIVFDVTNNHVANVHHHFFPKSSHLTIMNVHPPSGQAWIAPGETLKVTVFVLVPPTTSDSSINTVSLNVQGVETVEKSAHMYVRRYGGRGFDDSRMYVTYSFNNNCAGKTNSKYCDKTMWSVDVQVQDFDSGLKLVSSNPAGIYPRSEYISGTSSPVSFYYSNDCCNPRVEITAKSILGNTYTRQIDVTEWDNLSDGEIAAIVVGSLFIILLIILIILSIAYCMNRRKSQDLTYTHRYGSRSAPRVE